MGRFATPIRHPRPSSLLATAGAILAGAVCLAGSATLAAEGPGPMDPVAPSSPVPLPTGPLFAPPSIDPLDLPSGSGTGPAIGMPAELVGAWTTGNVGGIGYVDPNDGSYSEGRTQAVAYTFYPDGSWQYGFLTASQLYGCAMRIVVFRQGVVAAVDEVRRTVDLDTQLAQMHSEDTCVAEYNYDRELPPDDETLIWTRTTDQYGDALLLRGPTTDVTVFRPAPLPG